MNTPDDSTSILPSRSTTRESESEPPGWHGGLDFGLLVLRVVVGGLFLAHGLRHLFGLFGGMGTGRFSDFVAGLGYTHATIFAYVTGWTEIVGGLFLVLGLITPLAAAGVLGVVVNAIVAAKSGNGFFGAGGFELETVLAAGAFTLLFTGPGRVALDNGRRWFRYAPAFGFLCLLISAAATIVVLVVFRT
jgi:putative oxidoreductase